MKLLSTLEHNELCLSADKQSLFMRNKRYDREGSKKKPEKTYGYILLGGVVSTGKFGFFHTTTQCSSSDFMVIPFDIHDHPDFSELKNDSTS